MHTGVLVKVQVEAGCAVEDFRPLTRTEVGCGILRADRAGAVLLCHYEEMWEVYNLGLYFGNA